MKETFLSSILIFALLVFCSCSKTDEEEIDLADGTLELRVTDDSGNGISNIMVAISKEDNGGAKQVEQLVSNASGIILFENLESGNYLVSSSSMGWYSTPVNVKIKANKMVATDFILVKPYAKLKVLSYNVLKGLENNVSKKERFVSWVKSKNPDVICYQEMNSFTELSLRDFAKRYDHPYAYILKEDGYPVAISSKYPITHVDKVTSGLVHGFIHARIKDVHFIVLHLSPRELEARIEEMDFIKEYIDDLPGEPQKILVAGDFNSYSRLDQEAYGPTFEEDMLDRISTVPVNFTVTNTLMDAGFEDAYFLYNSEFKYSLPTDIYRAEDNPGARYDYIFLSDELSQDCVDADIIHDETTHFLSDHYPVWVELEND